MYFCVKCGTEIESGVFCSKHLETSSNNLEYNLKACECGRYKISNRWTRHPSPESFLKKVLKRDNIKSNPEFIKEEKGQLLLTANDTEFKIKIEKCDICARQHSQYFEGIMQLRYTGILKKRVEEDLKKQINFWAEKQVYITKEQNFEDGKNLWITNKKEMSSYSDKLQRKFGAIVSKNAKLFSRNKQTSKNIYRLNILVKFPEFEEGNVVFVNKKIAKVTQLRRQIKAIDLKTGKSFGFFLKDNPEIYKTEKTVITKILPEVTILNPETYEEERVYNNKLPELKNGKKVSVTFHEGKFYLIP